MDLRNARLFSYFLDLLFKRRRRTGKVIYERRARLRKDLRDSASARGINYAALWCVFNADLGDGLLTITSTNDRGLYLIILLRRR